MSDALENLAVEEEVMPDQALTLRQIFGEKLIDWGSADKLIRFITALGIAQIIVAVLLIGLSFLHLPSIVVARPDGTPSFTISFLLLGVCMLFMASAWALVMVGALHSRLLIRAPVALLFFGLHTWLLLSHTYTIVGWILMALALVYVVWHGIARPQGYLRDLAVFGLGVPFLYVALVDQSTLIDHSGMFTTVLLSIQIMLLSFLLMPLLMFTGLDLGESVRDMTRWLIGQGAARTDGRTLFWTAIGVCVAKLIWMGSASEFNWSWVMGALFLLVAGYITVRMKPWEGLHHEPQFTLLLAGAVATMALLGIVIAFVAVSGVKLSVDDHGWWGLILLAVLGAGGLLALGRRATTEARTARTFLALLVLWSVVRVIGSPMVWPRLFGDTAGFVDLVSVDGPAALLLPVLLLCLRVRGLANRSVAAWAISLTVGLSVIRVMYWMVDNNFDIPATAAAAQLVVLAAGLTWDVLTSGDKWTNGDSTRLPRQARVLLYFGYVSMTVAAILFWKGTGQTGTFDEDQLAIMGLFVLGVPVYLYGFARAGVLLVRQAWERGDGVA